MNLTFVDVNALKRRLLLKKRVERWFVFPLFALWCVVLSPALAITVISCFGLMIFSKIPDILLWRILGLSFGGFYLIGLVTFGAGIACQVSKKEWKSLGDLHIDDIGE
jgi:hypothetical protein